MQKVQSILKLRPGNENPRFQNEKAPMPFKGIACVLAQCFFYIDERGVQVSMVDCMGDSIVDLSRIVRFATTGRPSNDRPEEKHGNNAQVRDG